MSDTVIKAENLSKLYKLGEITTGTISHDLKRWWASVRGQEDPYAKVGTVNDRTADGTDDYVWALKDVDFEIKRGEAVGIIGRNGAGKSTLLKLLSKVTAPSRGCIKIKGRLASLLEVGTGFHPELTGRENIFLNGAILGMTKSEIKRKFDEIVDFAGVEKYIDTPVKRYSSGMYVRLAFAVAAHLEPEILIIDEVLAVGDAEFQKKCLGKMKDVSEHDGRTVLFVSHNMGAIQSLCRTSIILKNGQLLLHGESSKVISEYVKQNSTESGFYLRATSKGEKIWFKSIHAKDSYGNFKSEFFHDEPIIFEFELGYNIPVNGHDYSIFLMVLDQYKNRIFATDSPVISGEKMILTIPKQTLVRGSYSIHTFIHKPQTEQVDVAEDVCEFSVLDNGSWLNQHGSYDYGKVFINTEWHS